MKALSGLTSCVRYASSPREPELGAESFRETPGDNQQAYRLSIRILFGW